MNCFRFPLQNEKTHIIDLNQTQRSRSYIHTKQSILITNTNRIRKTNTHYIINNEPKEKEENTNNKLIKTQPPPINPGKQLSKNKNERKSQLIALISEILEIEEKPPTKSVFKFEISEQASKHNEKILKTFNYDYEAVLEKQKGTHIYYGSEFRNHKNLEILLRYHKSWNKFKIFLSSGTDTVLSKLDDKTLKNDCLENIKRGNHKSSSKIKEVVEFVNKQYKKEVSKGWMIPIPTNILSLLKNACVIPIGVTSQFTINEKAETIKKLRLTHDCSWEGPSESSINNRIDESKLAPLQYGRCILRVLHNLQFMRFKNPNRRILIFKHDLDSAYRRLHWHAKCALLCITIVQNIAYILTRLCFGIASGPSE